MTTEADEHLDRYLAQAEPRLRWLREHAAATGGPPPEALDFSRDSLVSLWAWAMTRFRLRPPGDRPDPLDVPLWYGRRAIQEADDWSDETLAVVDGLLYYLAECLLRAVPGARWEVGHSHLRNWIHEGQPVLAGGFVTPVELVMPMMNLVGRVFEDPSSPFFRRPAAPEDLRDHFDLVLETVTPT